MNKLPDKRLTILNEATSLFSEKGFHATSMQEVADRSHVSKGTIYTYFASKEELLLSIFKFFHETIQMHIAQAKAASLSPKDAYRDQIEILLSESLRYKAFFKMQYREQVISSHKTIQSYLFQKRFEQFKWYQNLLTDVYGEPIFPYLSELSFMMDSLINGFLVLMMIKDDVIEAGQLALYLTNRIDDLAKALILEENEPLLPNSLLDQFKNAALDYTIEHETDIKELINKMTEKLSHLQLASEKEQELKSSLHYFLEAYNDDPTKKFLFKGLLSNFEGIKELETLRNRIETLIMD